MVDCAIILATTWFSLVNSHFLVPTDQSPVEEIFKYDMYFEYVFSNQPLEWDLAAAICIYEYEGTLATFETDELKQFAVEAMSESNMVLDGLWLGLQKINGTFTWLNLDEDVNATVPDSEFRKCGNNSNVSSNCSYECTNIMECGAFVRANHSEFCMVNLSCQANRGFICRRPIGGPTTHRGWIKIRHRLYKIFSRRLSYNEASKACIAYDKAAKLAVVETFQDAQLLGRYLLVGRPSLERVWIGARWEEDFMQYMFQFESFLLPNKSDSSGYPPWRQKTMKNPLGCLLLDRHLSNITYFVESACDRIHNYMCYKVAEDDDPVTVCNVGDYDWRIYYNASDWFKSYGVCNVSAATGRLPFLERKDIKYFIYIMESTKRFLFHVWLGGYFYRGIWIWTYTNKSIPKVEENGYPPWVVNRSYEEEVEVVNLCLNIDRENALRPMFYGTMCSYPQMYICQYDKGTICPNGTTSTSVTTSKGTTTKSTSSTITTPKTTTTPTTTTKPTTTSTLRTTTTTTTPKTTTPPKTTTTATTPTTTKHTTKTTHKTTTSKRTTTRRTTRRTTTKRTTSKRTTTKRTTTKRTTTKRTTTKRTKTPITRPTTRSSTRRTPRTVTTKSTRHTTKTTNNGPTTEGPIIISTTTEWMYVLQKFDRSRTDIPDVKHLEEPEEAGKTTTASYQNLVQAI